MADGVNGKSLVEEDKLIKGAVNHKIKIQVEIKMQKKSPRRNVGVRKCFHCTYRSVGD